MDHRANGVCGSSTQARGVVLRRRVGKAHADRGIRERRHQAHLPDADGSGSRIRGSRKLVRGVHHSRPDRPVRPGGDTGVVADGEGIRPGAEHSRHRRSFGWHAGAPHGRGVSVRHSTLSPRQGRTGGLECREDHRGRGRDRAGIHGAPACRQGRRADCLRQREREPAPSHRQVGQAMAVVPCFGPEGGEVLHI